MNFRKIMALLLALVMMLSLVPATAAALPEEESVAHPNVPEIPAGYTYEGTWFTDVDGRQYFYIEAEASEFGISEGYWIDENGRQVVSEEPQEELLCTAEPGDEEALPDEYSSREAGFVTEVEDQLGGTCWAHASIAALESSALRQGIVKDCKTVNMSEYHLLWNSYNGYVDGCDDSRNDGYFLDEGEDILHGGTAIKACRALANFSGAVSESRLQLDEKNKSSIKSSMEETLGFGNRYLRDITLKRIVEINHRDKTAVKTAIQEYGGLYLAYICDQDYNKQITGDDGLKYGVYYNPAVNSSSAHAVEVVGWDDNFPKKYFLDESSGKMPSNNGAWLIKNSWGTDWGRGVDGYFWMSYEDKGIYEICAFEAAKAEDFERVYMHDGLGAMLDFDGLPSNGGQALSASKAASVFTADKDTQLTSFSLEGITSGKYELKIYKLPDGYTGPENGTELYSQNGSISEEGYIPITGTVQLSAGDRFSVVVSGISKCYAEGQNSNDKKYTSHTGESYYYSSGSWKDASEKGYNNICLRAVGKEIAAPDTVTWSYDSGSLSFSGMGKITAATGDGAWKQYAATAKVISLGANINGVEDGIFADFTAVESFDVDQNNSKLSVVDGVLLNQSKTTLYAYPSGKTDEYYAVPGGVSTLSAKAFCGNTHLKYLNMADCGITILYADSVKNCSGLTHVSLPGKLKELYSGAFVNNGNLSSVMIPSTVKTFSKNWIDQSGAYPATYTDSSAVISKLSKSGITAHTGHSHAYKSVGVSCDGQKHVVLCACGCVKQQVLQHSYQWMTDRDSTCTQAGEKHEECMVCGDKKNEHTPMELAAHAWVTVETVGADCRHAGTTYQECSVCHTIDNESVHANALYGKHHCVKGGDCDVDGCSYHCSCSCHKTGLAGVFWKVSVLFYRIFGTNRTCTCGAAHY